VILYVDTETFNEVPIGVGTARYAETAELMVISYALDDGPVQVIDLGKHEYMLPFQKAWRDADLVVAHNVPFDRTMLATKGIERPLNQWFCTQAQALAHSLPGALGKLSEIYNLGDAAKDKAGRALIQLFCKPRPKTAKTRRATRDTHPAEWQQFLDYAGQDIVALRELYWKLPRWNLTATERDAWMLNMTINERGLFIDQDLATAAIATCERAKAVLQDRTKEVTGTALSVQQTAQLKALLKAYGVDLPNMQASTLERRLEDPDLPEPVEELIQIRLETVQTSNAKWPKLLSSVSSDGRLRFTSQFCGASRTGRDSGRIFQPLNLPRPPKYLKGDKVFVEAIKRGMAEMIYDNPMEVTSAALRGALVAPPGRKLVVADLNAIEGRVAAWVAGEQWKLDAYARGEDLYVLAYAKAFGVPPNSVDDFQRQIGKCQELFLQFGGALGAFSTASKAYGFSLTDDTIKDIVQKFRRTNPNMVQFWWDLEGAVKAVTTTNDGEQTLGPLRIVKQGAWLRIILPSGRSLSYAQPKIEDGQFTYMGLNQYTRKWERISSYGGKLFENCLGADTEILTLYGWKRIIYLRNDDVVWDGLEWVTHDGVATQGPRNTVKLNGVGITPDHLVWANNQWEYAGEIDQERATSSFSRHFGTQYWGAQGFALHGKRWAKKLLGDSLRLRKGVRDACNRIRQRAAEVLRLPAVGADRKSKHDSRYVEASRLRGLAFDARSVREPLPRGLRPLRWAWHKGVRPLAEGLRRVLGRHGRDVCNGFDTGAIEQLEGVFTGQLRLGWPQHTGTQHESEQGDCYAVGAAAAHGGSGAEWYRENYTVLPRSAQVASGKSVRQAGLLEQTYDLLNCGPRHRFVVRAGKGFEPFLVHNCVQAIARDVLVEGMKRVEAIDYDIVLTVYDEIVAETAEYNCVEEMIDLLTTVPHWAPGLPLAANGFETDRYRKD